MKLLFESHSMHIGGKVLVSLRNNPNESYVGTIYNIINSPMNKGRPNTDYVDHFYITFAPEVYAKLLMLGSEIIHNHVPTTIGVINVNDARDQITDMTLQSLLSNERTVNPKNINAMLVWRIAYNITPFV